MFYWIQTYLIRHFKWFLIILLAVIIVSFVFTIGNFNPLGGSGAPGYKEQPFFGYDLSSAKDQQEIFGRGQISLSLNFPSFFGRPTEAQAQDYSLTRAAYLHMADEIGLPGPTKEELKEHVQNLGAFMNFSTQAFDQAQFKAFVDSMKASGLTEAYLTGVMEEDFRMNKIREILGGPGHILNFEAIHAAQRENTEWTLETASMNYADFSADISPTQEDLEHYFQANIFRYEVPPKAKASYIKFETKNYIDSDYQPEPGEKSIHFFTNKARYQASIPTPEPVEKEDGTTETPEVPEVTLKDVEDQVIAELRLEQAKKRTQMTAEDFAYQLFDKEIENGSDAFKNALAVAGVALQSLVPYAEESVSTQNGLRSQTLSQVFRLNENRYFSDPIEDGDAYVILIYQGEEPAYTPELKEVQIKVEADYREEKKRARFVEKGAEIKESIATDLTGGTTFESAAKSGGLDHKAYESFKRAGTPPEGLNQNLLDYLDNLEEGDLSDWIADATSGTIIYAAKKTIPDFTDDAEEVKAYLENQARFVGASNTEPILRGILTKELANTVFGQDPNQ